MAITGTRQFKGGERFVAAYKGKRHEAVAVKRDGAIQFTLDGGTEMFKTLSGAGAAVFGLNKEGKPRTCNGFSFWSRLEAETPNAAKSKPPKVTKPGPAKKVAKAKKARATKAVAEVAADGQNDRLRKGQPRQGVRAHRPRRHRRGSAAERQGPRETVRLSTKRLRNSSR
jgi:hypothetical protein